jgi:polar amino acid transport system substrate-binding protein
MKVTDTHKDFIKRHVQLLGQYDATRPANHVYEFHKHSARVANNMKRLALSAGYDADMDEILYWATLPHDIGKIVLPIDIWDLEDKPTEDQRAERRTHTIKGAAIVSEEFGDACDTDPFLILMINIMTNHHEHLDGTGFQGKTKDDLAIEVQMTCICDAFDGWSVQRPHFGDRDVSPSAVIHRMKHEKAGQFNQELLDLFETIVTKDT